MEFIYCIRLLEGEYFHGEATNRDLGLIWLFLTSDCRNSVDHFRDAALEKNNDWMPNGETTLLEKENGEIILIDNIVDDDETPWQVAIPIPQFVRLLDGWHTTAHIKKPKRFYILHDNGEYYFNLDETFYVPVLTITRLTKTFTSGIWPFQKLQNHTVVKDISFELKKGEILGLLGPNGAGKTTTIQMLLGLLTPTSGSIIYYNSDLSKDRIKACKHIGYASGYDKLPAQLTVIENLDIVGRIHGLNSFQRCFHMDIVLKGLNIWDLRNCQVGELSSGQSTRVTLAKAFMNLPKIVLLDEPTASLDPESACMVRKFLLHYSHHCGNSILLTSHNITEVSQLCDRVLMLKNGTIVADDTPERLSKSTTRAKVHLIILYAMDEAIRYVRKAQLTHDLHGKHLTVELERRDIAEFLSNLSLLRIQYSSISIDTQTYEDYFLHIAK